MFNVVKIKFYIIKNGYKKLLTITHQRLPIQLCSLLLFFHFVKVEEEEKISSLCKPKKKLALSTYTHTEARIKKSNI